MGWDGFHASNYVPIFNEEALVRYGPSSQFSDHSLPLDFCVYLVEQNFVSFSIVIFTGLLVCCRSFIVEV